LLHLPFTSTTLTIYHRTGDPSSLMALEAEPSGSRVYENFILDKVPGMGSEDRSCHATSRPPS
jgi:hypothetical protein